MFEKHACVTVMRSFSTLELLGSLFMQLDRDHSEKKVVLGLMASTKMTLLLMSREELTNELAKHLETKRCLIVLDDVSSTLEWDMIIPIFSKMKIISRIIVTTREENVANYCSEPRENICKLKGLEYNDARDLFAKKDSI
jgi:hypothetical protein